MIKNPTIYIPGTFDLWHVGHVRLFKYAWDKFYAPVIIAGVSSDELVESYKHIKPIYPLSERLETVKNNKYVNRVIIQNKFFDINQLKPYNIDCVLLGSDWKNKEFPELKIAQKILKFEIFYKPYTKEVSSSEIKKRIIKNATEILLAQKQRKNDK